MPTATVAPQAPELGFAASASSVGEGAGSATIEVRLSTAYHKLVSVAFSTVPGSARPHLDYQSVAGTLAFAPGVTSAFINVPIRDNTRDEAPKLFAVELSAAHNATLSGNRHTLTIIDNDPARVRMPDVWVREGDSDVRDAIVNITFDVPLGEAIELEYGTEPGTAQANDFHSVSGKLNIAAGATGASFTVPIVGDTIDEPDQTVKLFLQSLMPADAQILTPEATLTIRDDDNPPLLIVDVPGAVLEGNIARLTATLTSASEFPISVDWQTSDGTARAGSDYDAASGKLTFNPGTTELSFDIQTRPDFVTEAAEHFLVRFSKARYVVAPLRSEVWLTDADTGSILINDVWLYEGDPDTPSTAVFTVQMTPRSDLEVSVDYVTRDRSAQASLDYQAQSGRLIFAPGETRKTVAVPILGDHIVEPNETFELLLSGLSTDAVSLLRNVAIATILNDDSAAVEIAPTALRLDEGASAPYAIQLTSEPAEPVTIELITDARMSLSASAVTFDNTNWNTPFVVTVTAVDDDILYDTTVLTIAHTLNTSDETYESYPVLSVSVTVDDNDEVGLNLTDGSIALDEGESGTYQLSLRSQPLASVTVTLSSDSQLSLAPTELLFLTDTWNVSQTVTVTAIDDMLVEGVHIGYVDHALTSDDDDYNGSSPVDFDQLIVAIGDNDDTVLSIDAVSMLEGDNGTSNLVFTVTLTKPSTLPVTVEYTTQDGSALAGSDYLPVFGTLIFAPLETTQTITVPILGDTRYEYDETFVLRLSDAVNATISDTIGIATILNDDPLPAVAFVSATQTLSENVGLASFSLLVSEASGLPITVTLSLTGTATADDHTLTAGQIVIPPDTINATVPFTIVDDFIDEVDETLIVTLSAPQNAMLGATQTQTITIVDDDEYSVRFSQGQYSVGEADGTAQIYVMLESVLPYTVSVDYQAAVSAEGTATIDDFTPISGTLVFSPGVTGATFNIAIKDNTVKDEMQNKTVALWLSKAKGATIAAPNPAMLIIVDNDNIVGESESSNFYMTGGKNREVGNDTWYPRNGSYDYLAIVIPCQWPSSEPVYVDLFDPAITGLITDTTNRNRIQGAKDTTHFALFDDSGLLITAQAFSPDTYTDQWVRFATIDPANCGVYELRSETADNDSNGWSLRIGRDNDSDPGNTPPANYRDIDARPGTGDETIVGLMQMTVQLRHSAATCTTFYEHVAPGRATIAFHNYDLDASPSFDAHVRVQYYPPGVVYDPQGNPTPGSIAGTASRNGEWNNGSTTDRGTGDVINNPASGWWRIVTCANKENQYIQEGQQGVLAYLRQPPTPGIAITLKPGASTAAPGELRTITLDVTNIASGSSAGAAQNLLLTVDLPGGLSFEGAPCTFIMPLSGTCSVVGQRLTVDFGMQTIAASEMSQLTFAVRANSPGTQRITSSASYTDVYGNFYQHSSGVGMLRIQ